METQRVNTVTPFRWLQGESSLERGTQQSRVSTERLIARFSRTQVDSGTDLFSNSNNPVLVSRPVGETHLCKEAPKAASR